MFMDEVPVATNNPVVVKPPTTEPKKKPKKKSPILETLKNFFFMMPLAFIVFFQMYHLGKCFGEYTTFPPMSFVTYISIGTILLMLLAIQMMMRSIIYSVIAGVVFVGGIFTSWFGSFYDPVVENLSSVVDIVQAAWTKKDIPYQLVVTSSMTGVFAAIIFIQFLMSLLVKSFFEMIFGKSWGDGKWMGYLGAIALILGIQISFWSYMKYSSENKEKLIWKNCATYTPMDKFITRTPDSFTYNDEYIWIADGKNLKAINITNGNESNSIKAEHKIVSKDFQKAAMPIVAGERFFTCYSQNLSGTQWEIPYPEMTASDALYTNTELPEDNRQILPLLVRYFDDGNKFIAFFDYGRIGVYDINKGRELWNLPLDQPTKVSRIIPDKYIDDYSFIEFKDNLIIALQNGIIKCVETNTGKEIWEYIHTVSKFGGKAQRALLSLQNENVLAAFKTGEIVTISTKDGHIIRKASNESFVVHAPAHGDDEIRATFFTDDGLLYNVNLDGGNVEARLNAVPNKAEIYPIIYDVKHQITAHRDKIYNVTETYGMAKNIFKCKNRIFVTQPVFDDKIMYIGTQDGWVFCLHYGSESLKWAVHVDGELAEDSLAIESNRLLAKTKSGSVFCFNRNY